MPGPPPQDHSLAAEPAVEHLRQAIQILDLDARHGFWERRTSTAAVRRRILAALDLLERQP